MPPWRVLPPHRNIHQRLCALVPWKGGPRPRLLSLHPGLDVDLRVRGPEVLVGPEDGEVAEVLKGGVDGVAQQSVGVVEQGLHLPGLLQGPVPRLQGSISAGEQGSPVEPLNQNI